MGQNQKQSLGPYKGFAEGEKKVGALIGLRHRTNLLSSSRLRPWSRSRSSLTLSLSRPLPLARMKQRLFVAVVFVFVVVVVVFADRPFINSFARGPPARRPPDGNAEPQTKEEHSLFGPLRHGRSFFLLHSEPR